MAGKSGREISAVRAGSPLKRIIGWEAALVVIFIAVIIIGANISKNYTLANVLNQMPTHLAEVFIMFPMGFILVLGEIDISVGSTVCLSSTLACFAANAGLPLPVVILVCLLTGLCCGMINGAILTKWPELPPMIVTLGTQIIFRGIAEVSLGSGGSVGYEHYEHFTFITTKWGIFPPVFFIVLIVAVIFITILSKTTFGRKFYAIGSNRIAAQYAGVNVNKMRFIAYSLAGLMAGVCAFFLLSKTFGTNTTTGQGFEMDVIAMCVFGGIAVTGGKGNLIGALIAAFTIVCLKIALGIVNLNTQLILVIIGILLIVSVLISSVSTMIQDMRKKAARKKAELKNQ